MTFAPDQQQSYRGLTPQVRTVFFWVMMIALAVVLWQMLSRGKNAPVAPQMKYSDFMNQVDKGNVGVAHLYESPSTAEIQGRLRQPPDAFRVTIPKETVPDVTERLRKQGATVEVSGTRSAGWADTVFNFIPFILLLLIWIFMMRRRVHRPQSPPPANAANRPIG